MALYKNAALGGQGSDKSLEEAVAGLAHTFLADKAPTLMQPGHELGFQMLEKSDDDNRAVGVDGFNLNGLRAYVPIFCLNGEIKGHELLFLPEQNLFVPLKDSWIKEIMGNKPLLVGDPVEKSYSRIQGSTQPDLSIFQSPPKFASYGFDKSMSNLVKLACHTKGCSMQKLAQAFHTACNDHFLLCDIRNFLNLCNTEGIKKFASFVESAPSIKYTFSRLYPDVNFKNYIKDRQIEKRSNALIHSNINANWRDDLFKPQTKKGYVSVISYSATIMSGPPVELSESEKERLSRKGYLVLDNRKPNEVATIVQEPVQLVNPSVSSVYEVLQEDGKFKKMVVVNYKEIHGKRDSNRRYDDSNPSRLICDLDETKSMKLVNNRDVFVKPNRLNDEFKTWYGKLKDCESLTNHSFTVDTEDYEDYSFHNKAFIDKDGVCLGTTSYDLPRENIIVGSRLSSKLECRSGKIWVPTKCKRINVVYDSDRNTLRLGTPEILRVFEKKTAGYIKLSASNNNCTINGKTFQNRFDGLSHLIKDHNLREADAVNLFKSADADSTYHTAKVRIKRAYDDSLLNPNSAITFPEVREGTDTIFGNSLPTIESSTQFVQDPTAYPSRDLTREALLPQEPYPAKTSPEEDKATIQKAIQNGQSEIFNVSMLKQLLSGSSLSSQIDEEIPKLIRSMNQWGRNLFRFYWKGEQFKELYGPQELPELENNLRKLFELSGDVILLLKHKLQKDDTYGELTRINLGEAGD